MSLEGQRVLVIGGAGFIGSFVVKELLKHDVAEVPDLRVVADRAALVHVRGFVHEYAGSAAHERTSMGCAATSATVSGS